jgi:ketosteroid isomerase-like protein
MDELEILAIETSCKRLLMRYCAASDRKDFDTLMTVFADDAVWQRPDQPLLVGAGQIRGFFEALEAKRVSDEFPTGHKQRHLVTTFHVDVLSPREATSIAYALVWRDETPPATGPSAMRQPEVLVEYHDRYRKTAEGWRIVEHEARHAFRIEDYAERLTAAETARVQAA